jgi:hypothetical protein
VLEAADGDGFSSCALDLGVEEQAASNKDKAATVTICFIFKSPVGKLMAGNFLLQVVT